MFTTKDVKNLFDRTDDFNARLEHFESNSIDPSVPRAKVKLLEYRVGLMRLDVDDLNDRVKVFEEQEDTSRGETNDSFGALGTKSREKLRVVGCGRGAFYGSGYGNSTGRESKSQMEPTGIAFRLHKGDVPLVFMFFILESVLIRRVLAGASLCRDSFR